TSTACAGHPEQVSVPTRRATDLGRQQKSCHPATEVDIFNLNPACIGVATKHRERRSVVDGSRDTGIGGWRGANIHAPIGVDSCRSEEHTSELQSRENLVCRLQHE